MNEIDAETDTLVGEWVALPDVAQRLDIDVGRAKQLIRERKLVGIRRGSGPVQVPAAFLAAGDVVKGLPGTLTLLADAGYSDVEALRWLFTADDSLPGTPIQALVENRGKEVKRRAQALGF